MYNSPYCHLIYCLSDFFNFLFSISVNLIATSTL
nr:MAG TPA: hypothetical protein [Caudoviricetes sp.]